MESVVFIIVAILGYFLGSIPTGYVAAKARGIDIRSVGSGNIGATNAFRVLGKGAGSMVLLVDAVKGWLATAWIPPLLTRSGIASIPTFSGPTLEWLMIIGGLSAILGHNYTCWLKFKGGKGIATSAGVLLALVPWALLIIFLIWLITVTLSKYVSLGSVLAAAALPFATWLTHGTPVLISITTLMSLLAIFKHRANIKRLLNGTENRLGSKRNSDTQHTPRTPQA